MAVVWHDGQGMCLFSKLLKRGWFRWPSPADGVVTITPGQLGYLLEASTGGCRNTPGDRKRLAGFKEKTASTALSIPPIPSAAILPGQDFEQQAHMATSIPLFDAGRYDAVVIG
jgi:hypothetical protein